jgi:hypothetical protein
VHRNARGFLVTELEIGTDENCFFGQSTAPSHTCMHRDVRGLLVEKATDLAIKNLRRVLGFRLLFPPISASWRFQGLAANCEHP